MSVILINSLKHHFKANCISDWDKQDPKQGKVQTQTSTRNRWQKLGSCGDILYDGVRLEF